MKKLIFTIIMILGFLVQSQSLKDYRRGKKLSTAEINAIDTTRTDVIYYAYNTDLEMDLINRRDNNGWVLRFVGGSGGGVSQDASEVPFTPYFTLNQTNVQSAMEWIWAQKYDDVVVAGNGDLQFNGNGTTRNTIGKSSFDNQSVSLDGNTLNITNGTGVDLSPILNTSALTVAQTTQLTNAAKDFIATTYASDKTLIPSDRFIEATGFDIGRKRIVLATTEVTFTLDNSYAIDDIQRFKTLGSGVINIIPDTGVTIAYAGKTTLPGVSMTGVGTLGYLYKESSNNYRFYCETITGFDTSVAVSNFYQEQSNANASNTGGTGSFVSDQGGTFSAVTEDTFAAIRVFPAQSQNNDAAGIALVTSAVNTWSNNTLTLSAGDVLDFTFDYKSSTGGAVQIWTGSTLAVFDPLITAASFTTYTFQYTVPAGGFSGSAALTWVADTSTPFDQPMFVKNLTITRQ
jgi:hypothetical protein